MLFLSLISYDCWYKIYWNGLLITVIKIKPIVNHPSWQGQNSILLFFRHFELIVTFMNDRNSLNERYFFIDHRNNNWFWFFFFEKFDEQFSQIYYGIMRPFLIVTLHEFKKVKLSVLFSSGNNSVVSGWFNVDWII